jgi:hypothetical protein
MLPSLDKFHNLGSGSFGRVEEDEEDDGNGSREKNNDKGTMTTTNDCSGHGRRNAKEQWNWNIIAIWRQWRWYGRTSHWLPPWPVVGRHHWREEGCSSKMLSSCSNVDAANNNGANEDGWFQMNISPLII